MARSRKQLSFENFKTYAQFNHGGILRRKRSGRGMRPLSTKEPLHVVFKIQKCNLRAKSLRSNRAFPIVKRIVAKYAKYFFVKIDQITIQHDHLHLLVRAPKRSQFHHFFRVVAGQIAQVFENEGLMSVTDTPKAGLNGSISRMKMDLERKNGLKLKNKLKSKPKLWKFRPFTRVVRGWKAYKTIRNYIQLNEKEVLGQIPYNSKRLKGLLPEDWVKLWT